MKTVMRALTYTSAVQFLQIFTRSSSSPFFLLSLVFVGLRKTFLSEISRRTNTEDTKKLRDEKEFFCVF